MRVVKIIIAGWAMAIGTAMILFLACLWLAGPDSAERVWGPLPLSALFAIGLVVATRYMK
jgi:hypothetical protein